MVQPFFVVIFSFCLLLNKYEKATEALSLIHGHYYDDLESFDPIYRMAEFLEVIPN
jgi:hypothetical protein